MRTINENPIYYNKNRDIDFTHSKIIGYFSFYLGKEEQLKNSSF